MSIQENCRSSRNHGLLKSASLAALVISGITPALAQSTDLQTEEATESQGSNVIVVTATRRAESVQDVASSIAAFGADELQKLGVADLAGLTDAVAGAEIFDDRGAGQPTWVIRGVGLTDFNVNNTPTAAIYYDENYLVSNAMGGIGLFDLERVEVLKGPQGGLYGRNTTGGAVRVISAKPDPTELSGNLSASYGSWDEVSVNGAINIPLVADEMALRIAATTVQGGGWQDSLATPQNDQHGDRDFLAIRGQLSMQLSDTVEALFKVDWGRDNSETTLGRSTGAYDQVGNFCGPITMGQRDDVTCLGLHNLLGSPLLPSDQDETGRRVLSNPINRLNNDWLGINIQFDADMGFAELKTVSTYLKFDYEQTFDFDATPLTLFQSAADPGQTQIEQWQQEIRLVSTSRGPFTWLLGGLYASDTIDQSNFANIGDNLIAQGALTVAFPGAPPILGFGSTYRQSTRSWALYAEAGYDLTDTINVNGSFRYTDERKHLRDYTSIINFGAFSAPALQGIDVSTRLGSRVSGHFGIDWKPVDDVLVYAKYSRGFKSGGFFGGIASNPQELNPYIAETVNAYEFGVKSEPLDDLTVNGAVFYYDYRNAQGFAEIFNVFLQDSVTQLANVGNARHIGIELDMTWRPAVLEGFSLQASGSYLDAEISDSNFTTLSQEGLSSSVEGLTRSFSPKFSFFMMARQEVYLTHSLLGAAQVSYSYRDDLSARNSFVATTDFGLGRFDGYGVLNARMSLGNPDSGWELAVSGENLTNKVYIASATSDNLGSYLVVPTRPRRFKVEASYKF